MKLLPVIFILLNQFVLAQPDSSRLSISATSARFQQLRLPTAYAGPDQLINLPTKGAQLNGEGKTFDGKINFLWGQLSGPNDAKISKKNNDKTAISKLIEGEYQFVLTVFDSQERSAYHTVLVVVHGKGNIQPPVVDAGRDQTITLPQSSINLSGKRMDPNSSEFISNYLWTQISGPSQATIEQDANPQTRVLNLEAGEYQFSLRITDVLREVSGSDNVIIKVNPINLSPIAIAGNEQSIVLPANNANLSGDKSFDPDGSIIKYQWTKIKGPNQFRIVAPTKPQTQVTNLIVGVYQFELIVTDNEEAIGKGKVIINVYPKPPPDFNFPPIATAGDPQTITLPENSAELFGKGTDPGGRVTSYRWTLGEGNDSVIIVSPTQPQTQVVFPGKGFYSFELMVTDNKGATDTDITFVTVNPDTIPIKDTIIHNPPKAIAGNDTTIYLPVNTVFLNGRGTHPDSGRTIKYYFWRLSEDSPYVRIDRSNQAQIEVKNLDEGTYVFEFTVIDDRGTPGTDAVTITVKSKPISALIWIAIGTLGACALAAGYYFLFWIAAAKKVLVFYLTAAEEALVHRLMPDSIKTEGYAVGHCNSEQLNKLKEEKLAILILHPTTLYINTPGNTRSFRFSEKKGELKLKSIKEEPKPGENIKNLVAAKQSLQPASDFPSFFLITLDTPLLPVYEDQLKELGTPIIQRVPENSYVVFVKSADQYDALQKSNFNFIRMIQPYSARETGLMVREDHFMDAVKANGSIILDLILHRDEDRSEVINFLEQLKIYLIGSYRSRIRIRVAARLVLDYNLSANKFIQAIYEYIPPVLHNDVSRRLVGIDTDITGRSIISETGEGEIVAVADTGIDLDHADIKAHVIDAVAWGRKETNDTSDPHGHGTHVTGTIVGDGTASGGKIKGIAPGAKVFFQSLMDDVGALTGIGLLHDIFKQAYERGARIHNNSWGANAEARYTIDSTIVDEFTYENPEMLIIISAGNEGACNKKDAKEKGYIGFECVGSPATNKNGITVGASNSKRPTGGYASSTYGKIWKEKFSDPPTRDELISGDPDSIAPFSSRGRCDDLRMKPDIIAPGTDILSTRSGLAQLSAFDGGYAQYADAYAFKGGTSMAAPIVSGAAALVREYYRKKRNYATPSAALIKATLINGTRQLKSANAMHGFEAIPNPNQGYGMLDLSSTIPNEQKKFLLEFRDSLQDPSVSLSRTGQKYTLQLRTKRITWIRACLAYTDIPVRAIQNDLDLLMDFEPTHQKWSGNIGINAEIPHHQRDEDSTNNMEIIRVDIAQPGLYTIVVVAHNIIKPKQGFALVVTTGDENATFE